jgi:hypothetical protein
MFGFGKGKVDVALEKFNFSPGEMIKGKATLELKKIVKARGFKVRLLGERKSRHFDSKGSHDSVETVYDFEEQLDGPKEYSGTSTYNFEVKVPSDIASAPNVGGIAGTLIKSAQMLTGITPNTVQWHILVYLDVPLGFDVSKKIQITIG